MTPFDILLAFILLLGAGYGAVRGPGRQLMGLLSFWLALIISLWLYRPFSKQILQGVFTGSSPAVMDSFAFVILIIVFAIALQFILLYTSTSPEERRQKRKKNLNEMLDGAEKDTSGKAMNAVLGLLVGFVVTAIWMSVVLAVTAHILPALMTSGGAFSNAARNLNANMQASRLLPYFKILLRWIYLSVRFFTPPQVPPILKGFL
ncbi:MAG: CvpA family protein [Caldilineae bacterium]|nr:MAG: CvpA family protein [Caldilineae bacterium]